MNNVSKDEIIDRIEHILNYLLSQKHDADIKLFFKREEDIRGYNGTSEYIEKK